MTIDDLVKKDKWLLRDGVQASGEVVATVLNSSDLMGLFSGWAALAHLSTRLAPKLGVPDVYIKKGETYLGVGIQASLAFNSLAAVACLMLNPFNAVLFAGGAVSDAMVLYNIRNDLTHKYGSGIVEFAKNSVSEVINDFSTPSKPSGSDPDYGGL